jgi:hypothetical protein
MGVAWSLLMMGLEGHGEEIIDVRLLRAFGNLYATVMQQNNPGFSGPAGITERNSLGGGPEHVDHDEYDRDA